MHRSVLFVIAAVVLVLFAAGCSTVDKRVEAMAQARLSPERLETWTRPIEVSFEFGQDVSGVASYQVVLGVFKSGEVPSSARGLFSASTFLIGNITGDQATNPEVSTAAFKAAESVGADGIYITAVEIMEDSFLWLYKKRTITVRGKALTIVDLGQVDAARADNARYLQLLPSGGFALPETISNESWLPVQPR